MDATDIAGFDGRLAKVAGPARSGKTTSLIRRVTHLLAEGTDPESILVVTPSALAAQRFETRLASESGEVSDLASRVRVREALGVCTDILDTPEAREATGRVPRILTRSERNFLLEDMKPLGINTKRLREMLKFFMKQWSDGAPEEEWVLPTEEAGVISRLRGLLTRQGGMLEEEAPFICADFLAGDAGGGLSASIDYVFADDFQLLSRAEQMCAGLLAKRQFLVTGDADAVTRVATDYPNVKGLERFADLRPGADVLELDCVHTAPAIAALADALRQQDGMSKCPAPAVDDIGCELVELRWDTPEAEIAGTTRLIEHIREGEDDTDPTRIGIVVSDKRWGVFMARALEKRRIRHSTAGLPRNITGDPRVAGRHDAQTAFVGLALAADATDMVAWRAWCGFDHPLTNSDVWEHLMRYADERGLSLYDALAAVAADPSLLDYPRAGVLAEPFERGRALIAKVDGLRGFSLLSALGMDKISQFSTLADEIAGDEDAATLFALARKSLLSPRFPDDPTFVHILTQRNAPGLDYDVLFVLGLVDGMTPRRDAVDMNSAAAIRTPKLNEDRRLFCAAFPKADGLLVLSHFSTAGLGFAEQMKMDIARIRSEEGTRIAHTRPSVFLTEAGAARPSMMGGEDYLSRQLLN